MIKIKNVFLAIKDQMPLHRFIRNLWKGHVFGPVLKTVPRELGWQTKSDVQHQSVSSKGGDRHDEEEGFLLQQLQVHAL